MSSATKHRRVTQHTTTRPTAAAPRRVATHSATTAGKAAQSAMVSTPTNTTATKTAQLSATKTQERGSATDTQRRKRATSPRWSTPLKVALGVVALIAVLAVIYWTSQSQTGPGGSGQYPYAVGHPGPGQVAPAVALASTAGGTFNLASYHGKTVLLYFQEGLTCQPCWDQLKDLDAHLAQFRAAGIDQVVSITSDPLDAITQKVADEGITSPVLSDPQLAVSTAYNANQYGMMGTSRDGHSFVVVGPDGTIRWRADFGGAPNYTMYVPIPTLLADVQKGLQDATH